MSLIESSIALLKEYEPLALKSDPRGYLVNSSGGKDSIVLVEIFRQSGVKFSVSWNVVGIDPPELVYFQRKELKRLESLGIHIDIKYPSKSMYQMIIDHKTPPTRKIRYCCTELKEKRCIDDKLRCHSFGVRKAESQARQGRNELEVLHKNKEKRLSIDSGLNSNNTNNQLMFNADFEGGMETLILANDNSEKRKMFENCMTKGIRAVNPLIYWQDTDIWDFIHGENLDYCCLYDEGFTRLGCIGCPMAAKQRIKEFERYPKFKNYYLKAFEKMLERRKLDKVDENRIIEGKPPMNWHTAKDVMNWWLEIDNDENQLSLFD